MRFLKRLWTDIQRGENIDLYVTVILAIVLAILSIINIVPSDWITPLNLTVLALLSFVILGNRYKIETILEKVTERKETLSKSFPDEQLRNSILKSKEMLIMSADLNITILRNYPTFIEKLQKGNTIRVLLINPESAACDMAASLHYAPMSTNDKQHIINRSLLLCRELKQKTGGKIEVRLANHLLSFGAFMFDAKTPDGAIYLWLLTYKSRHSGIPKMVFNPKDGYWYDFFRDEIKTIWDNAIIWDDLN